MAIWWRGLRSAAGRLRALYRIPAGEMLKDDVPGLKKGKYALVFCSYFLPFLSDFTSCYASSVICMLLLFGAMTTLQICGVFLLLDIALILSLVLFAKSF